MNNTQPCVIPQRENVTSLFFLSLGIVMDLGGGGGQHVLQALVGLLTGPLASWLTAHTVTLCTWEPVCCQPCLLA